MITRTAVHSQMDPNNLITKEKKSARIYSVKILQHREISEIENLHPNVSTDLSVFILKTGLQNLSFSIDLNGLLHNSSLICYF